MSAQLNTLPAIRALLWERWRVMRWVVPGAVVLGVPVAAILAAVWSEVDPSYWAEVDPISILLMLPVAGALLMHGSSRNGYTVQIPDHLLRLPISNSVIVWVNLSLTVMFSASIAVGLLYALWWNFLNGPDFVWDRFALPLWGTLAAPGFVLSATAFAVGLYTLVALSSLRALTLAVSVPVLFWLTFGLPAQLAGIPIGGLPDEGATMAILWAWAPCVAIILASYPVGTALIGRARSNLRGAAAIGALREVRSRPPRNHPLWARVWFEWRTWGKGFVLFASAIALTTTWLVPLSVGLAEFDFDGQGSEGVFGAACVLGLVLLLMDKGKAGAKGVSLTWTTPVTTRLLYQARLLTAIGASSASLAIGGVLLASTGLVFNADSTGGWQIAWTVEMYVIAIAVGPALIMGIGPLLAAGIIIMIYSVLHEGNFGYDSAFWTVTGSAETDAVVLLLVVGLTYTVTQAHRNRMYSVWQIVAIGILSWLFMTGSEIAGAGARLLTGSTFPVRWTQILTDKDSVLFAGFVVAALTWHALWLHRCRHGGLGWRLGGEKWGQ